MMDWDRVRVFHAVAEAGSFTRAAETLALSQSAISRQIGALEDELGTPLFHRHARGLVLTERGEILLEAAREVAARIAVTESRIAEAKEQPAGHLRINATVGFGGIWLTPHLHEFLDLYPDITISLLIVDRELDLSMGEADVAIRLNPPRQPDLIQRRLLTAHTHVYAAQEYLDTYGTPQAPGDLDTHRLIVYGDVGTPPPVPSLNWVLVAGREDDTDLPPRKPTLRVNNVFAMLRAAETGLGLATLPDYLVTGSNSLVRLLPGLEGPSFSAYFVYPEELRASKRIAVFRDFLLEKVAEQPVW
ncbi:MAG TPA: LysR family transcriptional regulator [Geminicoccaceae bacterium]|nr:LysR family transcriptional regulator [Geminicoccaceae bacterium]